MNFFWGGGTERGEAAPDLSPVHLSLSHWLAFDVLPKMSSTVKERVFFSPFFDPPSRYTPQTYPPTTHTSETICRRSLILATILNHPTLLFSNSIPNLNTYRFPPLSGNRPPVSAMTFPVSLCCPTDALSATNGERKKKKKTP